MKYRKNNIALYLLASGVCASIASAQRPAAATPVPPRTTNTAMVQAIDSVLRAAVMHGFAGTVLIVAHGRTIVDSAYAPAAAGITRETGFWIGSVSKPFTASAILKLEAQGRLSVHDSISRFFPDAAPDKAVITIDQLLTHTSGIPEGYNADGIHDRDEAVRHILAVPLAAPPGSQYVYTGAGYNLLAAIIEKASGEPYERYMREQLLWPAGMVHSGFWGVDTGSAPTPMAKIGGMPIGGPAPNWGWRGSTGLRSTTHDLYSWVAALQDNRVLSRATQEEQLTPRVRRSDLRSEGYGWSLLHTKAGGRIVVHLGAESALGHYTALYRYPDDDAVLIMLSNTSEEIFDETLGHVLGALWGPHGLGKSTGS